MSKQEIRIIMDNKEWKKTLDEVIVKQKKYRDPEFTAQKLADEMGLSSFQLSRLLKKVYGMSFADITLSLRVKDAKKYLRSPKKANLFVEEIGILVGFKNKWSFFAAFRKYAGTTPNEWRKSK